MNDGHERHHEILSDAGSLGRRLAAEAPDATEAELRAHFESAFASPAEGRAWTAFSGAFRESAPRKTRFVPVATLTLAFGVVKRLELVDEYIEAL